MAELSAKQRTLVDEAVKKVLQVNEVNPEDVLGDGLGCDSLDLVEIELELEKELGIECLELSDGNITTKSTYKEMIDFVEKSLE